LLPFALAMEIRCGGGPTRAVERCGDGGCEAGLLGSVGGGEKQDRCASGGRLATMACSP
jgi:hypothetical protein